MTERLSDERLRDLADDDVSAMTAPWPEMRAMAAEVLAIRTLCAVFETADVERVIDNLVAAGSEQPLPHETLLPFDVSQQDARAAGPVMPEAPGDAVIDAACGAGWGDHWIGPDRYIAVYAAIRAALLKEQGR